MGAGTLLQDASLVEARVETKQAGLGFESVPASAAPTCSSSAASPAQAPNADKDGSKPAAARPIGGGEQLQKCRCKKKGVSAKCVHLS